MGITNIVWEVENCPLNPVHRIIKESVMKWSWGVGRGEIVKY